MASAKRKEYEVAAKTKEEPQSLKRVTQTNTQTVLERKSNKNSARTQEIGQGVNNGCRHLLKLGGEISGDGL